MIREGLDIAGRERLNFIIKTWEKTKEIDETEHNLHPEFVSDMDWMIEQVKVLHNVTYYVNKAKSALEEKSNG